MGDEAGEGLGCLQLLRPLGAGGWGAKPKQVA